MANLKEIRRRIVSIGNTKQITRAMKLVSAAKLRKAQEAAEGGRAYSAGLDKAVQTVLGDLPQGFEHPVLNKRDSVKVRRIICIAGERGLCGPYNSNIFRFIHAEETDPSVELEFVPVGRRAVTTAQRFGFNIVQRYEGLPERVAEWPIEEIVQSSLDDFSAGKCDEVRLYFTWFRSAVSQFMVQKTILPLSALDEEIENAAAAEPPSTPARLKYDPLPGELLEKLYPMILFSHVQQAGLEAKASEHAARMTAMEAATSNADELLSKLKLFYNRARQSAITTELLDVLGGAEALK